MLTRRSPAARNVPASERSVAPFVVIATSIGPVSVRRTESLATSAARLWRTVGSPPVRRMLSTP